MSYNNIIITGGGGFLGSHLYDKLCNRFTFSNIIVPRKNTWDLRRVSDSDSLITNDVDAIIHLAADVGGIGYLSKFSGQVLYNNLIMGLILIEIARKRDVEKFVFVGSTCAYPNLTPVPYKEEDLWNGYPDMNTSAYGIAKRTVMELIKKYSLQYGFNGVSLIPTNLYGPRDNFHPEYSHVIPALIKKFIDAKDDVVIWGTGKATREFLYVDDATSGIMNALLHYNKPDPVNLGTGIETSISELVNLIAELTDFNGDIIWDKSKPDGTPRRCLDISKAKEFGFESKTSLRDGLKKTIDWYKNDK